MFSLEFLSFFTSKKTYLEQSCDLPPSHRWKRAPTKWTLTSRAWAPCSSRCLCTCAWAGTRLGFLYSFLETKKIFWFSLQDSEGYWWYPSGPKEVTGEFPVVYLQNTFHWIWLKNKQEPKLKLYLVIYPIWTQNLVFNTRLFKHFHFFSLLFQLNNVEILTMIDTKN